MRISTVILFLILISACQQADVTTNKQIKKESFFDLKNYFETEVLRLEGKKNCTKIASINGEKKEQIIEQIDFEKELLIFSHADINKTAWSDKYSIDSLLNNNKQLQKIEYKALFENLKTRSIDINFEGEAISKIEIKTLGKSPISLAEKHLIYSPNNGYSILSKQDVTLADKNELFVEVKF